MRLSRLKDVLRSESSPDHFLLQAPRRIAGPQAKAGSKLASSATADSHHATFVWRIEHFSRLKDVLKKRKITGLCVKSRRFLVGGYTCRLIIYPRGGCNCSLTLNQESC